MNKKKVLAVCSSPYQLLVINRIIEEYYYNDDFVLVLLDTIANVEDIYFSARKEKIFSSVFLWKVKGKFEFSKFNVLKNKILGNKHSKQLIEKYEGAIDFYDVFLFANTSSLIMHIGNVLKKINPHMLVEMFEDGFSTYSSYMGDYLKKTNLKMRIMANFFSKINAIYLFNNKIIEWNPRFKIKKLEPVFENECLERINRIFNYNNLDDNYNKKIIFFEESYSADGRNVDDMELVEMITEICDKKDIFIKIHPRNPSNRFTKMGYITNKNINIPWEVIVLNEDFSKSVFVTIASNAAMNPFFLFNKKTPAVLLFKCSKTPNALYKKIVEFDSKLCKKYPDIFYLPDNYDDLRKTIKGLIRFNE